MRLALLKWLAFFSLCGGLSCALWSPPGPPAELPPVSSVPHDESPFGPGAVEWVQARFTLYQTGLAPFEVRRVAETVVAESERLGLRPELVLAVIYTESAFHAFARSPAGALGLMQIMPETGQMLAGELGIEWRGPETLFDPVINIRLGTHYLAHLHSKYANWDRALAAYNWGPMRIDRRLESGRSLPSGYVRRVTAQLQSPRLH